MAQVSDMEKLESDVRHMAKMISGYRQTLPDHLKNTVHSLLSSHKPVFYSGSDPLPPSCLTIAEIQVDVPSGTEDQESGEKMIQIKEKMSRNAANIRNVVKRLRECVESIDKLDSLERTIRQAL